ncbi:MAG: polyprenyl synthetase family protein [Oscillospiraceae bacterium]|nr:polyprenyl synthetase family protein [Oscillospiraceae bacterium]
MVELDRRAELINRRLEELMSVYTEENAAHQLICAEAMKYSLSAGGKRVRPVLVMEFARIWGDSEGKAADSACALEMIHTFSLIHDDLPCMDDDDLRRGKPSCHKKFGEDMALLAGDALENYAFDVIASDDKLSFEQRVKLIKCLSEAVGVMGMIGGQTVDVRNVGKPFDAELLLKMYSMKTGALIKCACVMGCICAERYDMIPAAEEYAEALGLAFQIVDDILDITADEKKLGKPVHSDAELNKATYPAVFGLEAAKLRAEELTEKAVSVAEGFPDSGFLSELTKYLLKRDY